MSVKYGAKRVKFSCPLSPYISWHWNLQYKECPVDALNRDMPECDKCPLRGKPVAKRRRPKKTTKEENQR